MVADARFTLTQPLRAARRRPCSTRCSGRCWCRSRRWPAAATTSQACARAAPARTRPRAASWRGSRSAPCAVEQLAQENARLRDLLELRPSAQRRARRRPRCSTRRADPYSRKVDHRPRRRRTTSCRGSPVINEAGVLGQVTRVYPLHQRGDAADRPRRRDPGAEQPHRRAQRGLRRRAGAAAPLELRFMAGNADVQVGDLLTTSGVDGVYPPGLAGRPRSTAVDRKVDSGFARIALAPDGGGRRRPPRAGARADRRAAAAAAAGGRRSRRAAREAARPGSAADANDHAARRRPAAAAGQPAVHLVHAAARASCSTSCRWAACRRCPTSLALVLVFWNVHQPRRVGVGVAFVFGLLMDVHSGAAARPARARLHAAAATSPITMHRRLLWFTVPSQAVQVLPLFLAAQRGVADRAGDRRRHVPGLGAAPGAGARGAALAGGDLAAARAAAPRARPRRESAAVSTDAEPAP